MRVGKISEHRQRAKPEALAGATRGSLECVVDDAALAVDGEHRAPVRLLDFVTRTPRSSRRSARSRDAPLLLTPASSTVFTRPGTPRSRWTRASGAKIARTSDCCGWSANSPRRSRGKDTRQLKSQCPADVLLAAEERLDRDLRRLLHAGEQGIP